MPCWSAANATMLDSRALAGVATANNAVSGQTLTHAMQPTQASKSNAGISAERPEKSRTAAVPGGMMLRATAMSAGSAESALPAP